MFYRPERGDLGWDRDLPAALRADQVPQHLAHAVELSHGAAPQHRALQLLGLCLMLLLLDLLLKTPAAVSQLCQPLLQFRNILLQRGWSLIFTLWPDRDSQGREWLWLAFFTSTSLLSWISLSLRCSGPSNISLCSTTSRPSLKKNSYKNTLPMSCFYWWIFPNIYLRIWYNQWCINSRTL